MVRKKKVHKRPAKRSSAMILYRLPVLVIVFGLLLFVSAFLFFKSFVALSADSYPWESSEALIRLQKVKPAEDILEVHLSFDKAAEPSLTLKKLTIKKGYVPKPSMDETDHTIQIIDGADTVIYYQSFNIPTRLAGPPPEPGKSTEEGEMNLKKTDFALTLPWGLNFKTLRLLGPNQQVVLQESLEKIEKKNNKQEFYSITGDELKKSGMKKLSGMLNSVFGNILGQTTIDGYLDITFIGDDYQAGDLTLFHTNINEFVANMLTYEPFASRAHQLRINYVDNTSDLGCYVTGRLVLCNDALVTQAVNNAGAIYDKIFVIYNNSTYGGAGGDIATAYNGYWGSQIFVHEFGHSFVYLVDEYLANYPYARDDRNCYNGVPPNSGWAGIEGSVEYFVECNYGSYYRSSSNSIMRAIDARTFNAVSQKYLRDGLDYYAGSLPLPTETPTPGPSYTPSPTPTVTLTPTPTSDTTPPTLTITFPANNAVFPRRSKILIAANASDSSGVAKVEFYAGSGNGMKLICTDTIASYTCSWTSPSQRNVSTIITAKAYDLLGNNTSVSITVKTQ